MVYKIVGWVSIFGSVLALGPSIIPGAMSVIGVLFAIGTLIMSILPIKAGRFFYFRTSAIISGFGIFVI
jgi:hypothetical protein